MTDLQEQLAFIRDYECSTDAERDAINRAIDYISNSAPVVHAHWIIHSQMIGGSPIPLWYACSSCGGEGDGECKFCPECGAKMDEESEESGNV